VSFQRLIKRWKSTDAASLAADAAVMIDRHNTDIWPVPPRCVGSAGMRPGAGGCAPVPVAPGGRITGRRSMGARVREVSLARPRLRPVA
jgi:hypothetical protein